VTVQYTYVYGEAIGPWTDVTSAAQFTSVYAEAVGPLGSGGPNVTTSNLFVEVIHTITAAPAVATVPILIACT
jgi:hypothetical protein